MADGSVGSRIDLILFRIASGMQVFDERTGRNPCNERSRSVIERDCFWLGSMQRERVTPFRYGNHYNTEKTTGLDRFRIGVDDGHSRHRLKEVRRFVMQSRKCFVGVLLLVKAAFAQIPEAELRSMITDLHFAPLAEQARIQGDVRS
jgi:hypothetical protein